jgi:glycosyltransferase involved in cell wall biosynthesis
MEPTQLKLPKKEPTRTIAIVTTCVDDWGGSEELWAKSIGALRTNGFDFILCKNGINQAHPQIQQLTAQGVIFKDLYQKKVLQRIFRLVNKVSNKLKLKPVSAAFNKDSFSRFLFRNQPSLVIINQAINFDGLHYAYQCVQQQIPFVIVIHKAVDFYWPPETDRPYMREALQNASKCLFVSKHNHRLTEEQFGIRLNNSQVIYNPVKISGRALPFPSEVSGYRIACIARLFILDKGQDMLLRILAKPKWKERPVTISFVGTGADEAGLRDMAALLQVTNVEFLGHQSDIEQLWHHYHALILPSRSEGMPLTIMEAMAAGRPVIVTNAGGNAERVEEGVTGYIGEANETSFEETMERAWQQRNCWETIGKQAAAHIVKSLPASPENEFANLIKEIANEDQAISFRNNSHI